MLYRVSQRTLYRNINNNLGFLTWDMSQYTLQLSSGKKVNKPSDDPTGGATILAMRTILADIDQYNKDVALADDWLKTTESILQSMKDTVERANVLTEQMSTDTYSPDQMDIAADEIDKLFEALVKLGNTRIGDRYIFAGQETEDLAFTDYLHIGDTRDDPYNNTLWTGEVITQGDREFVYRPDVPRESQVFVIEVTSAGGILDGTSGYSLARGSLDPQGDHNALFFEAVDAGNWRGTSGNAITINYVTSATAATPSVSVAGSAITVSLVTSGTNVVTTAWEVMSAINNDATAGNMVNVSLSPGNSGNGEVTAMSAVSLADGYTQAAMFRVSQDGGKTWSVPNAFTADDLRDLDLVYNTELGHSTLTTSFNGPANDLQFVAKELGSYGNDIRVRFVDDQPAGSAISVEVCNNWEICVHLENSGGSVVSTANDVMNAINSHTSASLLLTASLADYREGGAGVVDEFDTSALSGGDNFYTSLGHASYTTDLYYDAPDEKNPNITFTSLWHGTSGNSVEIEYTSAVASATTFATTSWGPPPRVTINLANSAGTIFATVEDVVDAVTREYINNNASALVTASMVDWPDGRFATVSAAGVWNLAGGDPVANENNHGVNIRFEPDGSPLSLGDRFYVNVGYYQGDEWDLDVNSNQGARVQTNIRGDEALGATGADDNILDTLTRLSYALRTHDTDLVGAELPELDDALEKLTSQMARAGVRLVRNQFTFRVLDNNEFTSTERMSRFEDVDFEEAITGLQTSQTAYQATLASTSMITKLSLVDYIR